MGCCDGGSIDSTEQIFQGFQSFLASHSQKYLLIIIGASVYCFKCLISKIYQITGNKTEM